MKASRQPSRQATSYSTQDVSAQGVAGASILPHAKNSIIFWWNIIEYFQFFYVHSLDIFLIFFLCGIVFFVFVLSEKKFSILLFFFLHLFTIAYLKSFFCILYVYYLFKNISFIFLKIFLQLLIYLYVHAENHLSSFASQKVRGSFPTVFFLYIVFFSFSFIIKKRTNFLFLLLSLLSLPFFFLNLLLRFFSPFLRYF